jgi:hypothetical protein
VKETHGRRAVSRFVARLGPLSRNATVSVTRTRGMLGAVGGFTNGNRARDQFLGAPSVIQLTIVAIWLGVSGIDESGIR